jgi:hypothetical protein
VIDEIVAAIESGKVKGLTTGQYGSIDGKVCAIGAILIGRGLMDAETWRRLGSPDQAAALLNLDRDYISGFMFGFDGEFPGNVIPDAYREGSDLFVECKNRGLLP